ncbi:MAG: hypothetical protein P0Y56_01160 [Candidatus Andeanibacterium colombiense]|uniref:Uncharacterized protein n=1 Tax=Candidatus Andeanibacterium colombiense TaxID=3121345 RepID=A0AAJ5X6M0_9SPHN|nr:MAG: hypothetical protein P0Y56_01160 [Sphingomonadaceae bacterium]
MSVQELAPVNHFGFDGPANRLAGYEPGFAALASVAYLAVLLLIFRRVAKGHSIFVAAFASIIGAWLTTAFICVIGWVSTPDYYGGQEAATLWLATAVSACLFLWTAICLVSAKLSQRHG